MATCAAGGMKATAGKARHNMSMYKSMAKVERAEDSKSPKVREMAKRAEKRSSGKSR